MLLLLMLMLIVEAVLDVMVVVSIYDDELR